MRHRLLTCLLASMMIITVFPVAMTDNATATEVIIFDSSDDFFAGTFNNTDIVGSGPAAYLTTHDDWIFPNQTYRHRLNITEKANVTLNDFQVRFFLDTQSLIGAGEMNANCSDLRFAYLDTELPYWIKGPVNDPATEIWLKTSVLGANVTTADYFMYYGNTDAVPASDWDSVFEWQNQTVHSGLTSGNAVDLAIGPNNLPQMVHFGATGNWGLWYAGMQNYSGNWINEQIKWEQDYNGFTDSNKIAVDSSNKPHVVYCSKQGDWLNYSNRITGSWSAEENIVIPRADDTLYHDLALDTNDLPHVSYCGAGFDLSYANKTSGSWTTLDIDTAGDVGGHNSITIGENNWPHFAYLDTTGNLLKYGNFTGIWNFIGVDSQGAVGRNPFIQLDDNNMAHIINHNKTSNSEKYSFQEGAGWNTSTILPGIGDHYSAALGPDNYMAVAWENNFGLNYTYWNGTAWVTEAVDNNGTTVGDFNSLVFDSYGFPMIGYHVNHTDGSLLKLATQRQYISPEPTVDPDLQTTKTIITDAFYTTASIDIASSATDNFNLVWSATVENETSLKFQVASNDDNATWDYAGPDGTNITFYDTSGQQLWAGHSGHAYMQIKAYFNITNTSRPAPKLDWLRLDVNHQPDIPSSPSPTGASWTSDSMPLFTWTFTDSDSGDSQMAFRVQIDDDNGFGSINYDSGQQASVSGYWDFPGGTAYSRLPDGDWYWRVRVQDSNGLWSNYTAPILLSVDSTPPTTTASINGNNHTEDGFVYLRATETLTLAADDGNGSGVASTWYRIGADGTWTEYTGNIALGGLSGNVQFYFNSTDTAGNHEAPQVLSLMIDSAAGPSSVFEILGPHYDDTALSGLHYITSDSVIVLTLANQTYRDMATIRYRIDNGTWMNYSNDIQVTAPGYEHSIDFYAVDIAGNEELNSTIHVFVDDESPSTTLYPDDVQTTVDGVMHVAPADVLQINALDLPFFMAIPGQAPVLGSGVETTWYNVDDGLWKTYIGAFSANDLKLSAGLHKIGYVSIDKLGNVEAARHMNIYVDISIPFAIIGDDMMVEAGRSVHFTAADSIDDGVIINWTWEISVENGTRFPKSFYNESFDFVFDTAGTYTVKLTVEDGVGNTDDAYITVVVIPVTDLDADGLPDAWEVEHFGDLSQTPVDDPDSDGLDNAEEYAMDTDPTVAEENVAGRYFLAPFLPWWLGWLLMAVVAGLMAGLYIRKPGSRVVVEKEKAIIPPAPFDYHLFEDAPIDNRTMKEAPGSPAKKKE